MIYTRIRIVRGYKHSTTSTTSLSDVAYLTKIGLRISSLTCILKVRIVDTLDTPVVTGDTSQGRERRGD